MFNMIYIKSNQIQKFDVNMKSTAKYSMVYPLLATYLFGETFVWTQETKVFIPGLEGAPDRLLLSFLHQETFT